MFPANYHLQDDDAVNCLTLDVEGRTFTSLSIGTQLSLITKFDGDDQLRKIRDCIDSFLKTREPSRSDEEREANARLIAAAPELLEALRLCVEALDDDMRNIDAAGVAYAKGWVAIAKALGERPQNPEAQPTGVVAKQSDE